MNKFVKYVIIIALFCAALYLFYINNANKYDKNFAISDISHIDHIYISKDSIATNLNLINGEWMVNKEHSAHQKMLDNLKIISSKISVEYPLPTIYSNSILSADSIKRKGTLIQFYKNSKLKQSYYIYSADSIGCVGLLENAKQAYILYVPTYDINAADYIDANPNFWLDNIVFSYRDIDIKSISVENIQEPEQSFHIKQLKDGNLQIFNKNNVPQINSDSALMKRYFSYFGAVIFDHYINSSLQERQAILSLPATYILKVETNKETKECRIIPIPSNEKDIYGNPLHYNRQYFYLSVNNSPDIALVSWLSFDILLKNLSDFAQK